MNDEAALLAAIVAHPDEDTPRLAYADWLDENEAPIQAEFIRVQCRLAACSAADPDYPDLVERHAEIAAQFRPLVKATVPKLPPGFVFEADLRPEADDFRRGFLYTVRGEWAANQMDAEDGEIDQFAAGLPQLVATTTARRLDLSEVNGEQLARVLAAPGAEAIGALTVTHAGYTGAGGDAVVRVLADSRPASRLEALNLYGYATAAGLAALAGVKFDRLATFDLPMLSGRVRDLAPLTRAAWFGDLRDVHVAQSDPPLERALVAALARAPRLERLDLRCSSPGPRAALAAARGFPALARLAMWSAPTPTEAERLARAPLPRLAALDVHSMSTAAALALLRAEWFPRLRSLAFGSGRLTDKFVVALSKSGAAANLRALALGNNPFGKTGLATLADGGLFPAVTTLDLETATDKVKAADAAAFARALSLPRLRHLDLSGWPLGDAGAKALAANPALAGLTRLSLHTCGLGEKGLAALARSPHLQNLIELDVQHNKLKTASALRNTGLLPRLAAVRLSGNAIPAAAHRKLHAARGLAV